MNPRRAHAEDAAQHLTAAVLRASPLQRVAEVRAGIGGHALDDTELVCVVDVDGKLLGTLSFAALYRQAGDVVIGEIMVDTPAVRVGEDQEKIASIALHHRLNSVPVVDAGQRLLGVVPTQSLLQILRREHVEDIHRLAGIRREGHEAQRALDAPPLRRARDRLPWLIVGLLGSLVATLVMSRFEAVLHQTLALAFFIPGLVYLADAIGTQTEAVVVRGLSLAHIRIGHLLAGELRTGLIIGAVLGGVTFPMVWLAFGDPRLAFAVSGSLVVAGGVATTLGLLLPWLLARGKRDPAFGSGPLATVIQDVLTLLVYFSFVSLLYPG